MTTIKAEIIVSGKREDIWQVLADFAHVDVYHPIVQKSYVINGAPETGLGAERRCELSTDGKRYQNEKITRWIEGKEFDVEISGGNVPAPVKNLVGTVGMETLTTNQHRIYLITIYQPVYGLIGQIVNMIMVRPFIARSLNRVLQGLREHLETQQQLHPVDMLRVTDLTTLPR